MRLLDIAEVERQMYATLLSRHEQRGPSKHDALPIDIARGKTCAPVLSVDGRMTAPVGIRLELGGIRARRRGRMVVTGRYIRYPRIREGVRSVRLLRHQRGTHQ